MEREELLRIAYEYYPKNIDCVSDKSSYIKSKQYKALLNKINQHQKPYPKEIIGLVKKFEILCGGDFVFRDATYFEWQDRCYTFEFIKNIGNTAFILKFYKSIITQFFFIQYFQTKVKENISGYFEVQKEDFQHPEFINDIYNIAQKNCLEELNPDVAYKRVPYINFDDIPIGEFTYFNAFFNSQNFSI